MLMSVRKIGMRRARRDKRAVSIIVAYVLLITIAIALSTLVYSWLRFYVNPSDKEECPDGVSLVIKDYSYDCMDGTLNLTLQNKGRFNIYGFVLRVTDKENSSIGVYTLKNAETIDGKNIIELEPGNISEGVFSTLKDATGATIKNKLTFMEVQPFIKKNNDVLYCGETTKQVLGC